MSSGTIFWVSKGLKSLSDTCTMPVKAIEQSMELRNNEPLYNEDLGITNYILQPSNNKMYGKGPQYNEPPL